MSRVFGHRSCLASLQELFLIELCLMSWSMLSLDASSATLVRLDGESRSHRSELSVSHQIQVEGSKLKKMFCVL